jgi:hypothetical protein
MNEKLTTILQKLTGGKSTEQIKSEFDDEKWPYAISEEQIRADVAKDENIKPSNTSAINTNI